MLVMAMLSIGGGHWAALQTLAWSRMLVDNTRDSGLKAAVIRTFDGQHPCSLCREIERGRKSEEKPAQTVEMAKLVLIYQPTPRFVAVPRGSWDLVPKGETREARSEAPRLQPPRAALG